MVLFPGVLYIQDRPKIHICLKVSHLNLKTVSMWSLSLEFGIELFNENMGFGNIDLIGFHDSDLCQNLRSHMSQQR